MDNLYKILIVDDEKPARMLLRTLLQWEDYGFTICGEAKNGKEAYDMYLTLRPDLIITDIEMPIMNGLDFIRLIRATDDYQRFIILSCYEDFSYAREAIGLRADDYMIKDLLKEHDIIMHLLRIKDELLGHQEDYHPIKIKSKPLKKVNKDLKDLLFSNNFELINSMIEFNGESYYSVYIIGIDDYHTNKIMDIAYNKQEVREVLEHVLSTFGSQEFGQQVKEFAHIQNGQLMVIMEMPKIVSESGKLKLLSQTANLVKEKFKADVLKKLNKNYTVTVAIGRSFNHSRGFKDAYLECLNILKYRMFVGKDKTIDYNSTFVHLTKASEKTIKEKIKGIQSSITNRDKELANQGLYDLYHENLNGFMQYNFLKEVNGELFLLISNIANDHEIEFNTIFGVNYLPIQQVNGFDTVDEIIHWYSQVFDKLFDSLAQETNYTRHVTDAISYINENFRDYLSLADISEALNLHKVYLSRIFKEETTINISKYIQNVRMDKAKELILTTNLKFYEIGDQVGYANSQHFVVTFKKNLGLTPKEYREKFKRS